MMKKYLVCYSDKKYRSAQKRLKKSAYDNGIDKVFAFRKIHLKITLFYRKNKRILKEKKGSGYWIWKPYFILKVLDKMNDDDFLIYSDSGIEILSDLSPLFDLCQKQGGMLFFDNIPHKNATYTKRDCFILMNYDSPEYYNSPQCMGGFMVLQNKAHVREFIQQWLNYMEDIRIISDNSSELGEELPNFKAHRHDQSVLSLLLYKNNIPLYRDPSQWGKMNLEEYRNVNTLGDYGVLIYLHRDRSVPFITLVKCKLKSFLDI